MKTSIATSVNEGGAQGPPDQSGYTNMNPIQSQSTFLIQPRVEAVKSRLDNLFQTETSNDGKVFPKIPKPKPPSQQQVQCYSDHEQS